MSGALWRSPPLSELSCDCALHQSEILGVLFILSPPHSPVSTALWLTHGIALSVWRWFFFILILKRIWKTKLTRRKKTSWLLLTSKPFLQVRSSHEIFFPQHNFICYYVACEQDQEAWSDIRCNLEVQEFVHLAFSWGFHDWERALGLHRKGFCKLMRILVKTML